MDCKDVTVVRKKLLASLGDNSKIYMEKMKSWFHMKLTKEEFDREVRQIMNSEQVSLHNEFLLCLFNKIRGLATTPLGKSVKQKSIYNHTSSIKEKILQVKRKYASDKSNFEPADIYADVLNQTNSPAGDEPIGANRSSAQELLLPDHTFVLARLMLAAWENNMDGAEDSTAYIIIAATQIFLKNILTAMFAKRSGFNIYNKSVIHNIGEPVYDMWKRNSSYIPKSLFSNNVTNITPNLGQTPIIRQSVVDAENAKTFAMACASQTLPPTPPPVSLIDFEETLKVHKSLVKNHSVYATNFERLFTMNNHLTWEDVESKALLQRSNR